MRRSPRVGCSKVNTVDLDVCCAGRPTHGLEASPEEIETLLLQGPRGPSVDQYCILDTPPIDNK